MILIILTRGRNLISHLSCSRQFYILKYPFIFSENFEIQLILKYSLNFRAHKHKTLGLIKNKSESNYSVGKSTIDFFGVEANEAKAHGPRRDILFINECNRKISNDVFDHLNSRTQECTFLDFNPDIEFLAP